MVHVSNQSLNALGSNRPSKLSALILTFLVPHHDHNVNHNQENHAHAKTHSTPGQDVQESLKVVYSFYEAPPEVQLLWVL